MSLIAWKALDAVEIRKAFGTTTVHEKPVAFAAPDGLHHVVLRGELDETGEEVLWWSLTRAESGESVELARNYGVEEVDGEIVEVSWDGLFPAEWIDSFASGFSDWIRISVTELLEKFGETVEFEQPQAWRHRAGEFYLVLLGEIDAETEEEEYAWSLVREQDGEYVEIAECHSGNGFGADELEALVEAQSGEAPEGAQAPPTAEEASPVSDSATDVDSLVLDEEDEEALFDGWWELPPFDWGDRMVRALDKT
jgi:hypothetical protein